MEGIKDLFVNPGREYRAKPFWAWNGKLEKDELKRQLEVIKKMGFGGFFMHSRTGLATEYLGEEWFDITNFVADEAEKMGLEAWLYDEDRWPSGTAGGMVTKNPEYRIKYMRMSVIPSSDFRIDSNTIACFGAKIEENNLIEYKRVQTSFDAKGYEKILVFEIVMGKSSTWFNNTTYLDTMDKDAVQAFIESTHEKYKSKCGERLGKSIKGIFTDEPERGSLIRGSGCDFPIDGQYIPYTRKLFSEFIKKFGYDLIDHLPELWFVYKEQVINQATWHYILLLQDLFCENYFKRINTWCKDNSLIFTGHAIEESTLASQIDFAGSLMRCYEEMEYPGMDMLTANRYFWTDVKQLSSVAHQTGKKWMLSELYGATGWDFNFEGHKNVGSWQSLYGISLRCPHLSWYTMSGEAKRDYPASILHQSAWYGEYKRVEDYFARFAVLNTETNPVCDIL
ncbi:MAG: glycosyl hydrolase, partial [Bacillota bacterium]|nr:glycosyl hydrolase [Bacillota bacterium]